MADYLLEPLPERAAATGAGKVYLVNAGVDSVTNAAKPA
jgi:hypothetical protein